KAGAGRPSLLSITPAALGSATGAGPCAAEMTMTKASTASNTALLMASRHGRSRAAPTGSDKESAGVVPLRRTAAAPGTRSAAVAESVTGRVLSLEGPGHGGGRRSSGSPRQKAGLPLRDSAGIAPAFPD